MEIAEPEQQQLGRYRIERTLGAGGMGVVYLARDTKLQRPVAIKKLRTDATSTTAAQRIQSEAQLLAQLNHPNIVQLHDVIEDGDGIALVMEYVEGTTLQQWMREYTPGLQQKLELLIQICNGLTEAHSLGIIHRDLKSDNILITENGKGGMTAKITDFGIAKSLQQDSETITREDHVAGTVDAMSPEQLQGYPLCPRSDLFSLGTIAYELLCGAKPFEKGEGGAMALAHKVVSDPHIPPQQAWPNLPEPLAVLLDKLLSKDPLNRPESAAQVAEALTFLHQQGADTDTREFSATVTQLLRKPPNKRKRLAAALAGLAVLGSAGYWGWKEITRLEPQYIAVLPVEINGEVRGEENAKALTATMVRQALMNATSQLKASALVSFTPKEGQDFDAQLQALRDKGVTDALFARLECAQVRCEIELQRIGPIGSQIKEQVKFEFLTDKRQDTEYRLTNSVSSLFSSSYLLKEYVQINMRTEDYNQFLDIRSRTDRKELTDTDLRQLESLVDKYPKNVNLYRAHAFAAGILFVMTNDPSYLQIGQDVLAKAKLRGIEEPSVLELELWLYTFTANRINVEETLQRLKELDFPPAALLSKYARLLYMEGDYASSLAYAQKAADLHPTAENLYLSALSQTASGNYESALITLTEITEKFPDHWPSYSALGVVHGELGNFGLAEAAISKIPIKLRNWRTYTNLGAAYALQNKIDKAVDNYKKALDLAPDNLPTLGNITEAYLLEGDEDAALQYFRKLLSLTADSTTIEARRYRAWSLAYLGEIDRAISEIHQLNKDAPNDTNVKYITAQVYVKAGEYRSGAHYVEQLLNQGMGAEWFILPIFQHLCTQMELSQDIRSSICR